MIWCLYKLDNLKNYSASMEFEEPLPCCYSIIGLTWKGRSKDILKDTY